MGLVADYSSDSDGSSPNSPTISKTSLNEASKKPILSTQRKKEPGPLKIVLEAPKFSEEVYSDDEKTSRKKGKSECQYQSISFSKLKFKGKGSSLFDLLPPPKGQDNPQSKPQEKPSSIQTKKPQATAFIPHTVKSKPISVQHNSQLLTESLFPIGKEIQDAYTNESLIPQTLPSAIQPLEEEKSEPNENFYYGYDYSATGYTATSQEVEVEQTAPETLANLPREAEKFFGGMRRRDQPINIQEIDLNHELNSAEAVKARTLRASTIAPSSNIKLEYIPSTNQKRSHNIMYLAHQAQMRDSDLQDQYSANKLSKRQSQAKYGF